MLSRFGVHHLNLCSNTSKTHISTLVRTLTTHNIHHIPSHTQRRGKHDPYPYFHHFNYNCNLRLFVTPVTPFNATLSATMCTFTKSNPQPPHTEENVEKIDKVENVENVETKFKHTWVHKYVPVSLRPYFMLARVDRPIAQGTWLLLWPCWWSIGLASAGSVPSVPLLALFGCGAFLMRGAGCTFNDMVDKDIDVKVARTRTRPIASGTVSRQQAVAFLGVQLTGALAVLLSLNNFSIVLGASSLLVVACYPFMKRITWYPQAWLGLAFNWGALLGWSSVQGSLDLSVVLPLYVAGIAWTIVYDTIYAHMDKSDDVFLGIGSTAIKFGKHNKIILASFGVACIASFIASGYAAGQSMPFYVAIGAAAGQLAWQISTVKFDNNADCMRKFISNKWFGAIIFVGILLGNLFDRNKQQQELRHVETRLQSNKKPN